MFSGAFGLGLGDFRFGTGALGASIQSDVLLDAHRLGLGGL